MDEIKAVVTVKHDFENQEETILTVSFETSDCQAFEAKIRTEHF